jgi:hypothetical protein
MLFTLDVALHTLVFFGASAFGRYIGMEEHHGAVEHTYTFGSSRCNVCVDLSESYPWYGCHG